MYALEELEENIEWLEKGIEQCAKDGDYLIVDCPGQVEAWTHHGSLKRIVERFAKLGYRVREIPQKAAECLNLKH